MKRVLLILAIAGFAVTSCKNSSNPLTIVTYKKVADTFSFAVTQSARDLKVGDTVLVNTTKVVVLDIDPPLFPVR